MKIKNALKNFCSMQKQTGGFTLVELIVVIAILAILAGVAIPAYSGYITKANETADQQLLAAINRAFTAACNSNGFSQYDVDTANIVVNPDGTIGRAARSAAIYLTGVTVNGKDVTDAMNAAFAMFFEGNDSAAFKIYRLLTFVDGAFVNNPSKSVTIGGNTYHVSQSAIDNFKNATVFSQNVEQMQGQVDSLAGAYGGIVGSFTEESMKENFGEDYVNFLKEQGAESDTAKGNATVLYIAQQSANMTAQDAMDTLANAAFYMQTNGGSNPDLFDMLEAANSTGDTLSTAAMMYGAVTAYANGSNNVALKNQAANVNDAATLMLLFQNAAQDQGFLDYCGSYKTENGVITSTTPSADFERDMNGYLGALNGMNSVSGGVDINDENLWSGDAVDQLLKDMLG